MRPPRLIFIPVRILLITFLLTLLSLALGLLLGILGIVMVATVRGVAPNLTLAYRYVGLPTAAVVGVIALIAVAIIEVRNYRRDKALADIERAA